MPVEIVVGTNSYLTLEEAVDYFGGRLFTANWDSAPDDDKAKALIMATASLNRKQYKGKKKVETQKFQFPRCYPVNPLSHVEVIGNLPEYDHKESWYCEQEVSDIVKNACCEEALAMLERGNSQRLKLRQEGVTSITIGSLGESYGVMPGKGFLSLEAKELLKPYLAGAVLVT